MPRSKRGRSAPDYDSDHEDHLAASDDDDALMDDDDEEALTDDEEEEVFEECEEMGTRPPIPSIRRRTRAGCPACAP